MDSIKSKCCGLHILGVNAVDSKSRTYGGIVMKKKGKQKSMTGIIVSLISDYRQKEKSKCSAFHIL